MLLVGFIASVKSIVIVANVAIGVIRVMALICSHGCYDWYWCIVVLMVIVVLRVTGVVVWVAALVADCYDCTVANCWCWCVGCVVLFVI